MCYSIFGFCMSGFVMLGCFCSTNRNDWLGRMFPKWLNIVWSEMINCQSCACRQSCLADSLMNCCWMCRSTEEMVFDSRGPSAVVQTSADDVRLLRLATEACISEHRPASRASELVHAAQPDYITILTSQPHCLPSPYPLPSWPHPRLVISHFGLDFFFFCISSSLMHYLCCSYVDLKNTKYSILKIMKWCSTFVKVATIEAWIIHWC